MKAKLEVKLQAAVPSVASGMHMGNKAYSTQWI